ncbi:hypothetical protein Aperf_G00000007579 [Anoplocephala perfoliata]
MPSDFDLSSAKNRPKGISELINAVVHEKPELIVNFASDPEMLNQPDRHGNTPLHHAARIGSTASVYILFAYGCTLDPLNCDGYTPLVMALKNERLDTARLLLFLVFNSLNFEKELDLDLVGLMLIQPCPPELKARSLYLALGWSAAVGHVGLALMLLEAGANINYFIPGIEPPLFISIDLGYLHMVEFWIEHGAPLERYDNKGLTPLMTAVVCGELEICETLIKNGASIDMVSADGLRTALSIAKERGQTHIVECLLNHAAPVQREET